jgi:hypothetical protein
VTDGFPSTIADAAIEWIDNGAGSISAVIRAAMEASAA